MGILNAPFKSTGCHEYNLSDFSEDENFYPEKYGGETFLVDAGQRSRAIIPGDDTGDQQPPEPRDLYPDSDAVQQTLARSASTNRYCP